MSELILEEKKWNYQNNYRVGNDPYGMMHYHGMNLGMIPNHIPTVAHRAQPYRAMAPVRQSQQYYSQSTRPVTSAFASYIQQPQFMPRTSVNSQSMMRLSTAQSPQERVVRSGVPQNLRTQPVRTSFSNTVNNRADPYYYSQSQVNPVQYVAQSVNSQKQRISFNSSQAMERPVRAAPPVQTGFQGIRSPIRVNAERKGILKNSSYISNQPYQGERVTRSSFGPAPVQRMSNSVLTKSQTFYR